MFKYIIPAVMAATISFSAHSAVNELGEKNLKNMVTACNNGHDHACTTVFGDYFYTVVDGKIQKVAFKASDFAGDKDSAKEYVRSSLISNITLEQLETAAEEARTEIFAAISDGRFTSVQAINAKLGRLNDKIATLRGVIAGRFTQAQVDAKYTAGFNAGKAHVKTNADAKIATGRFDVGHAPGSIEARLETVYEMGFEAGKLSVDLEAEFNRGVETATLAAQDTARAALNIRGGSASFNADGTINWERSLSNYDAQYRQVVKAEITSSVKNTLAELAPNVDLTDLTGLGVHGVVRAAYLAGIASVDLDSTYDAGFDAGVASTFGTISTNYNGHDRTLVSTTADNAVISYTNAISYRDTINLVGINVTGSDIAAAVEQAIEESFQDGYDAGYDDGWNDALSANAAAGGTNAVSTR